MPIFPLEPNLDWQNCTIEICPGVEAPRGRLTAGRRKNDLARVFDGELVSEWIEGWRKINENQAAIKKNNGRMCLDSGFMILWSPDAEMVNYLPKRQDIEHSEYKEWEVALKTMENGSWPRKDTARWRRFEIMRDEGVTRTILDWDEIFMERLGEAPRRKFWGKYAVDGPLNLRTPSGIAASNDHLEFFRAVLIHDEG